ncbi:hypothetical protein [Maridesulfovibrio frigidus]|uniref:hypothetical protein n=1 Tax=Maridesulfovibrio frigidus TaxID=340956 RepID=UPI0004E1D44F|nr:hypothetical protein [Maridesulfovibrio frigidus]
MITSTNSAISGAGSASSYFTSMSKSSSESENTNISSDLTESQIRRQLQMQFASQSFGLTSDEQQQVGSYFSQLNNIYGTADSSMREDEEKKFQELKYELDDLYGLSDEPKQLTDEEKEKADEIQTKLDELYNILPTKDPEGADLNRAESLKWELRKLYYPEGKTLSVAEKKVESSIQVELKELFGIEGPKNLSSEEQTIADGLRSELDELMGTSKKELTDEEKVKADEIISEMEELAGNIITHGLSTAEKNLYKEFDNRFNELTDLSKERELTEKEQELLAESNQHINTLLSKAAQIQDQQDTEAKQVHTQMGGFFSQMGYEGGGSLISTQV